MTEILIPYDFSKYARRALALAIQGYPFGKGKVLKVHHVIDEHLYENILSKKAIPDEEIIVQALKDEIETVKASLPEGTEIPEIVVRADRGRPAKEILEAAADSNAVGIMIGGQGHGGVKERVLGRTALRVIREFEGDVYVVRDSFDGFVVPRRLCCAVDMSEISAKALKEAARLADENKMGFSLIKVTANPYIPYLQRVASDLHDEEAIRELRDEDMARLKKFEKDTLGQERADTHNVVFGWVADTIISQAQALNAGTIVMGARGLSAISRALLGSVTEGVIARAHIDVLVVR
ncbi:MAG: universal stress protein [Chrysiogenetes bacterium]|nr:universal stress protein [Chrysiogenetes bacterium]